MLDSVRPGVIEEWQAYDRIEPFGDEQLTRLLLYAISAMGVDADWDTLRRREPVEPEEGPTEEQTAQAISRAFGL